MAGPGNVPKTQDQQGVASAAHIARWGRTLPDRPKTQTKTTDRQSRTLRPFIWPSVGRFLPFTPVCPSSFPEARWGTPAYETARESIGRAHGAVEHRRAAKESAC
ncbi:hypothetical protein NFI95_16945 [Acetobacteraceae bacterium KSS8]|uniref:Uncharacterized protein n=1 Tax=Endosaccharibacter trunci TaxID=2812733 RepID=A0ABT1WB67_9PROT|nr:hypothetical protein [Acetobacteraceae bacterium KSS8]